ncbi:FHA [Musa troglodytarum]|uniref:FHA n=1 Tax=Musa troglodytarum TaxID=320322 RepID=A0A9E7G744_9LILI|nr:FHA [Musa troglodytarum]
MGALATLTKWIPEDDFLLKNAVEAGASLESLAKGAVSLGRGTDDVEVDIDLREEGHANKISRRQINNHKNSSNEKFSNSHNL